MKRVIKLFLIFTMLILSSCKDNKKSPIEVNETIYQDNKKVFSEDFSVILKVRVEKEDTFQIFYIQDPSEVYNAEQFVSVEINPDVDFQDVELRLPDNVYPYNIRIDLGTNSEQGSIQIETMTLSYKNESYVIAGDNLQNYFFFNDGIVINPDAFTYTLKTFESNSVEVYDPHMVGKAELNDVIYTKL